MYETIKDLVFIVDYELDLSSVMIIFIDLEAR